jgi:uncharacterized protein YkwD
MNAEARKPARPNSRERVRTCRAVSRAQAVAVAGLAALVGSTSPSYAETGDTFLSEVNRLRAEGVTCPAFTRREEVSGTVKDVAYPEQVFAPNGGALARDATLDRAAQEYVTAVANGTALAGQEGGYVAGGGYLALQAASYFVNRVVNDEAAAVQTLKINPYGCRELFSPNYSEVGIATAPNSLSQTVFLFVVATPFDPSLTKQYAQAILADVNRVRAQGVTCPDGRAYPPKPPFTWSDGLAQVAQQHSEYMASNWDGNPARLHDNPQGTATARATAIGCQTNGIYENVGLPGSLTPAEAWTVLSAGHCSNVMLDRTHAGVGIGASNRLVEKGGGGPSFVTLDISNVTGACPPGTTSTTQPGTTTQPTKGATKPKCWEQTQRNPRSVPRGFEAC